MTSMAKALLLSPRHHLPHPVPRAPQTPHNKQTQPVLASARRTHLHASMPSAAIQVHSALRPEDMACSSGSAPNSPRFLSRESG